jgi:hypothetical protein
MREGADHWYPYALAPFTDTMAFSVARPSGLKWMCRQSKKRNPVSTLDLMQIFSPYARWLVAGEE